MLVTWFQGFAAEAVGRRRRHVGSVAPRAPRAREARNRAEVVAMATALPGLEQPEFAKDLFAAASNHRAS